MFLKHTRQSNSWKLSVFSRGPGSRSRSNHYLLSHVSLGGQQQYCENMTRDREARFGTMSMGSAQPRLQIGVSEIFRSAKWPLPCSTPTPYCWKTNQCLWWMDTRPTSRANLAQLGDKPEANVTGWRVTGKLYRWGIWRSAQTHVLVHPHTYTHSILYKQFTFLPNTCSFTPKHSPLHFYLDNLNQKNSINHCLLLSDKNYQMWHQIFILLWCMRS